MNHGSKKRYEAKIAGFRSGFEAEMAGVLGKRGIVFKYEDGTIKYDAPVRGGRCNSCGSKLVVKGRVYVPDFRIGPIVLETKGKLDGPGRTKLLAIKASNPTLDLRLVFQRDNRIRRGSTTKYSEWARSHGFKFHVGTKLPIRWIRELRKANEEAGRQDAPKAE